MDWLKVVVVSALPISELRGGIPLALYLGFNPVEAYAISVMGNLLPIPFLLLFLSLIEKIVLKTPLSSIYLKIVRRTERRKDIIDKYGYLGLTLFVAIPLPVTGAWTGCLLAFLLGLDKVKSLVCVALGVALAGIVVLATSLGVLSLFKLG
ncbi:COG2426 family protein [Archaeoglobus sp.]